MGDLFGKQHFWVPRGTQVLLKTTLSEKKIKNFEHMVVQNTKASEGGVEDQTGV